MRTPHHPTAYDDDWEDQPAQGPFFQWVLGAGVPLVIALYGVAILVTRQAEYGRSPLRLQGGNAIAFGVAIVSLALFLHSHYFWGNVYANAWFAVLGKIVAACGFIGGLGVVMVRVGVLGVR